MSPVLVSSSPFHTYIHTNKRQSGAVGSGHAAAPTTGGLTAVLKQGWEDLKHGGAKAPHAVSTGVSLGRGGGGGVGVE